jgi:hypothetical protein
MENIRLFIEWSGILCPLITIIIGSITLGGLLHIIGIILIKLKGTLHL